MTATNRLLGKLLTRAFKIISETEAELEELTRRFDQLTKELAELKACERGTICIRCTNRKTDKIKEIVECLKAP